ncbi:hypothetical protein L3Q82_022326 [Scortum barcoo]|uniref:Uncharacterized protein n=1 Tax=Scortum barcoo TaxID=214431 RepID=A0ACB8X1A4_9TELE|nr:hypothetical protein L3Q82_022326 [Scortum barcoo]
MGLFCVFMFHLNTSDNVSHVYLSCFYLQINLRLILVSGKTKEFLFSPNDSAADIAKHVYDNWPMDWEEEQVSSPNILRLIYQGRFLHGNVTLGGTGETRNPIQKVPFEQQMHEFEGLVANMSDHVRGIERRPGRVTAVSFCKYTPPPPAGPPSFSSVLALDILDLMSLFPVLEPLS